MIVHSTSPEETFALGEALSQKLPNGGIVCFFGDLAAGKTTFIKGLASQFAGVAPEEVSSPTFVLLNIYEGKEALRPVFHFDLYRLTTPEEFFHLGFEEYWSTPGITCIEWAERIEKFLPQNAIRIHMRALHGETREISIEGL